jgi:membrane-bound serine protease (ClpP class)
MMDRSGKARAVRLLTALAILFAGAVSACADSPNAPPGAIHVLTADGTVNPVMERYIDRGINGAEASDAGAVVLRLDTPGGLSSSMDDIVQRIINADVPVITYVWPQGGQAASAGTFIAYASHIAAMAPGTVIGSATPIDASGGDIEGDLGNKVKENAAAKIREYAELRGRNAEWGASTVYEGKSASATEALQLDAVDFVADDLEGLLGQVDGTKVALGSGQDVTLATGGAEIVYNNTNFIEDFLDVIADPNIAFLLLSLGSLAIFIELANPGSIFPGVFGVISLLLGFFALSVIPFDWTGVALIMFAFLLFALEIFVASHGVLGIGGAISLVLGGLLLTSDNPPEFQVSEWLVFTIAGVLSVFVLFIVVNVIRIRTMPAQVGVETMIGRRGIARSDLNPLGYVFVNGEYWSAESEGEQVHEGDRVIITAIKGLKLRVRKQEP